MPLTGEVMNDYERRRAAFGEAKAQSLDTLERIADITVERRDHYVEYWQRLGPEAIFEAAWQMVVDAHSHDGSSAELQLRRTIEHFHREQR